MIQAWEAIGSDRPICVQNIEIELWKALIEIAKGKVLTVTRLHQALEYIDKVISAGVSDDDSVWFMRNCELSLEFIRSCFQPSVAKYLSSHKLWKIMPARVLI